MRAPGAIRTAAPDDIPAIRAILAQHGNDTPADRRLGPDVVGPYVRHLLAHHRAMVCDVPSEGVVAFGAVADVGIAWHLADLFVRSDMLGQGIGRRLLTAMYDDRWPRTTFASDDPRALPSYVRAGLTPRWVALFLRAGADEAKRAAADPRARTYELVDGGPDENAALERAWTGADRTKDHELWAAWPGADPFIVHDTDGPVAVGYGRGRQAGPTARGLDRMVIRPGVDPVGPVLAAVARCAAGGTTLDITLPGPHPALPILLEAGFRIEDRDVYCSGPTDPVDAERLIPSGGLL